MTKPTPTHDENGRESHEPPRAGVYVRYQPPEPRDLELPNQARALPKANTVRQLLNRLGERPAAVLVIRDADDPEKRRLLTQDMPIKPGELLTLRRVTSRG